MSLPLKDLQHLTAAEGYIELGMYEEADAELQETSPLCHELPVIRTMEICVCVGLGRVRLVGDGGDDE